MTAKELSANIGKTGNLRVSPINARDTLLIPVTIVDAREVFGRTDYKIDYNGQLAWTSAVNLKLD